MELLLTIFFALLGLIVGSFINVCIDRLPEDRSIISPPSRCPHCQRHLTVPELIPLLSFLWLHGRCRTCSAPIPKRIFFVELSTGILFALLYYWFGLTPRLGIMLFYTCVLMQVFVVDLEQGLILNKVVYPAIIIAILFAIFIDQPWIYQFKLKGVANFALAGAIGFGLLFLIAFLSRGGMGWGDVKFAALIGLCTGFPLVFVALIMAAILGGIVAVPLLIMKKKGRKEAIPFGPFLVTATYITLLWGTGILHWYINVM